MYKRIVLAYDGSESGQKALLDCRDIAQWSDAELHLVAVMPSLAMHLAVEGGGYDAAADAQMQATYRTILDDGLRRLAESGHAPRGELRVGDSVREITQHARNIGADLIVVGHRHLDGWAARWWRGATSPALIEHAHCSVRSWSSADMRAVARAEAMRVAAGAAQHARSRIAPEPRVGASRDAEIAATPTSTVRARPACRVACDGRRQPLEPVSTRHRPAHARASPELIGGSRLGLSAGGSASGSPLSREGRDASAVDPAGLTASRAAGARLRRRLTSGTRRPTSTVRSRAAAAPGTSARAWPGRAACRRTCRPRRRSPVRPRRQRLLPDDDRDDGRDGHRERETAGSSAAARSTSAR